MTSEIKNKTYTGVSEEIDQLKTTKKERITAILIALFSGLLVISGPVALSINMLIFENYMTLFEFVIAISIVVFAFVTDYIYLHLITKNQVQGLYHIWVIDVLIVALIVLAIFFGLYKIKVI